MQSSPESSESSRVQARANAAGGLADEMNLVLEYGPFHWYSRSSNRQGRVGSFRSMLRQTAKSCCREGCCSAMMTTSHSSHSSPIFAKAIAVVSAVVLCLWSSDSLRSSSRRSRADNGHSLEHSRPWGIIMATSETNEAGHDGDTCWPPTNMPPHLLNGDRSRLAPCVKYSHIVRALRDEYLVGEEEDLSWETLESGLKAMTLAERNGYGPSPGGPLAGATYEQLTNAVKADYYAYEKDHPIGTFSHHLSRSCIRWNMPITTAVRFRYPNRIPIYTSATPAWLTI